MTTPDMTPTSTSASDSTSLARRTRRTIDLVRMLGPREVRVRYRQSLLDVTWALINPVVVAVVYGYILTRSFDVTATCGPYVSSTWTGLVLWTFFATALGSAVTSLTASSDLVTKVYFPREALPLSMVAASLVDLAIGFATLVAVLAVQGVSPTVSMVAIVVPVLVLLVWTAALGVIAAVLASFARDIVHGVHLGLRVGFFATPVMYDAGLLPSAFAWSADYNPVAVAIDQSRTALLCGTWPDFGLLGIHLAVGSVLLFLGVVYTRSIESRIADVV